MNKRLISTGEIKTKQVMSVYKCRHGPTKHLMKYKGRTTPMQMQRHAFIFNYMYVVSMYGLSAIYIGIGQKTNTFTKSEISYLHQNSKTSQDFLQNFFCNSTSCA